MLTRYTLKNIDADEGIVLPPPDVFDLPEKVLQFGTGVLLRGLPDYFIDKANRSGIFNGRIVVIKSTDSGNSSLFDNQDGLFTTCIRGVENGIKVEENIINSSISRVISAKNEWGKVLQCASDPEIKLIISNTTEVGISFVKDDISLSPPVSFPGKLLSFLYERFKIFHGSADSGLVVVPTELITENGKKLESIVLELAHLNGLEESFMDWLENSNYFCNTLVDRIVPGSPGASQKSAIEHKLGYQDGLMIIAESYRLWAIESAEEKVKEVLSFSTVDAGVVIAPDITKFRELKLRLLNGTHTLSCALALLAGHETVKEAMDDGDISGFMKNLMLENISPAIINDSITTEEASEFAFRVLDRFRNPSIDHQWLSISMQYSSKMKMRNLPVLLDYYERCSSVPEFIALGFAAYLLLMKVQQTASGFVGEINGRLYTIHDDKAAWFSEQWSEYSPEQLVERVLSEESLWGTDLTDLKGFTQAVTSNLVMLINNGAKQTIRYILTDKKVV
jgi:tagaturonate reductase